jgi:hypothetical protein
MNIISNTFTYKEAAQKSGYTVSKLRTFVFNKRHYGSNFNKPGRGGLLDTYSEITLLHKFTNINANNNDYHTREFRADLKTCILKEAKNTHTRKVQYLKACEEMAKQFKEPSVNTLNRYCKKFINELTSTNK